jgi:hypothetical protein
MNDRVGMAIIKAKQTSINHEENKNSNIVVRTINYLRKKSVTWNSIILGFTLLFCEGVIINHGISKEL